MSQKSNFSKRVDPCFWLKKCNFFHYFFSLKIRLEVRFNNVLDREKREIVLSNFVEKNETSFDYKNGMFQSPQNRIFLKGLQSNQVKRSRR